MTFRIGRYYRGNRDIKPQQWGTPADVQSSIFANADREGYDPGSILFLSGFWEKAGKPRNLINYEIPTTTGTPVWHQEGVEYDSSSTDKYLLPGSIGTSKLTVFMDFQITGLTSWASLFTIFNSTGSKRFHASRVSSATSINFNAFNAASNFSGQSATGLYGVGQHQIFQIYDGTKATNAEILRGIWDRKPLFLTYFNDPATTLPGGDLYIGAESSTATASDVLAKVLLVSTEAYTDSQIAYLSDNPYFLLHRQPSVFYSVPSGEPATFNPAWARNCNNLISGSFANV